MINNIILHPSQEKRIFVLLRAGNKIDAVKILQRLFECSNDEAQNWIVLNKTKLLMKGFNLQ